MHGSSYVASIHLLLSGLPLCREASGHLNPYPNLQDDLKTDTDIWGSRVQRGGTFLATREFAQTTSRLLNLPDLALQDFGFRIVRENEVAMTTSQSTAAIQEPSQSVARRNAGPFSRIFRKKPNQ